MLTISEQIRDGKGYHQSMILLADDSYIYRVVRDPKGCSKGWVSYKGEKRTVRYFEGQWYLF